MSSPDGIDADEDADLEIIREVRVELEEAEASRDFAKAHRLEDELSSLAWLFRLKHGYYP